MASIARELVGIDGARRNKTYEKTNPGRRRNDLTLFRARKVVGLLTMALQPLNRVSVATGVINALTQTIQQEEIKVGGLLPSERILAVQLGVSRVMVREALKVLEQQGRVLIRHGIGVQVTNNPGLPIEKAIERILPEDRERLCQCAQARLVIEPELAALAASCGAPDLAQQLLKICQRMKDTTELDSALDLDMEFHEMIATMANNQVLGLMLKSVSSIGRLSRAGTISKVDWLKACDHHDKISAAILSGKEEEARSAMKDHLQSALYDLT
jgi:GntR family transcriptional repressor for pyruvate dehydrogenase complex